jgi:8-oxo-dGTP diphosphatase
MARARKDFEKLEQALALCKGVLSTPAATPDGEGARLAALEALKAAEPCPALRTLLERPKVGVGVLLTGHKGSVNESKYLAGRRLDSHGAGRFALPGGHLEAGESWGECASREVAEECGVTIAADRFAFVGTTNDVMPEDKLHYITIFVKAELTEDEIGAICNPESDKCEGWSWMSVAELSASPLFIPLSNLIKSGALNE